MSQRTKPTGRLKDVSDAKKGGGVLLPHLRKVVLDEFHGEDEHWDEIGLTYIHPSEMAKADWCPLATYLRIIHKVRPPQKFDFGRQNIFDEGHSIHAKWQARLRKTGKLWGEWRCHLCGVSETGLELDLSECCDLSGTKHFWEYREVPLLIQFARVAGHADGMFVLDENYLVELKSVGLGTLRIEAPKLVERNTVKTEDGKTITDVNAIWYGLKRPLSSHVRQGVIYIWLAQKAGLRVNKIVFLYESKMNQQVKEFTIELTDSLRERVLNPLLETAADLAYALDQREPPECPQGGCEQCEEIKRVTTNETKPGRGSPDGTSEHQRRREAQEAGDSDRPVGSQARRGTTRSAGRSAKLTRSRTDAAVPEVHEVDTVPGPAAGGSGGRRVLRIRQSRTRKAERPKEHDSQVRHRTQGERSE